MLKQPTSAAAFILWDGFKLLTQPGIRRYAAVPVILGFCIFALLFSWLSGQIPNQDSFEQWLDLHLWNWVASIASYLIWLIWPLFFITAYFLVAYTAVSLINIIGAPFNGVLSEKAEQMWGYPSPQNNADLPAIIQSAPQAIWREIVKFINSLKWLALLLILLFFPLLNILSILIGAWLMAIQFLDIPADNHQLTFKEFLIQLKQGQLSALLFGLSVFIISMIPLLNFIVVPAAICAATALWHNKYSQP